ncbi:MAG TPA: ribonuclease Z [Bacilli bacterium]
MELYFFGTGAGTPTKARNVTSIALRLLEERGVFWMFDCGEGTQHQVLHSPLKLGRLEKLFVTHLHGDHLYGIPGLLTSRSYKGGESGLDVYGPPGIREAIETILKVSEAQLSYELAIHEIAEGVVFEDQQFIVETLKLEHRIDSYGYRVTEKPRPGRLQVEKLLALGVKPGPILGKIKHGENVTLDDGTVIHARDFVSADIPGRIVTVLGDTRPCENAVRLGENADVLVHEATFAGDLGDLARKYFHSTVGQAATAALEAKAKALIMTHISTRYQPEDEERLLAEAKKIFAESHIARDFWSFPIPNVKYAE